MITCHFIIAYNAYLNKLGNVKNRQRILQAFAVHQASLSQTHSEHCLLQYTGSLSSNIANFFFFFQTKNKSKALQAPAQLGQACP